MSTSDHLAHPRRRPVLRAAILGATLFAIGTSILTWRLLRGDDSPEPWNVLLVTLDTTRADHLGCYGYRHADTPTIDSLSQEGVTYERCNAPVPLTLPSHCSMLTGLWPPRHGVHVNGTVGLSPAADTLAEVLQRHGYTTGAVISAYVLDRKFGLQQGFDHYDDDLSEGIEPGRFDYSQRNAEQVTDAALRWLQKNQNGTVFLWVHYFDPHAPYEPPGFQPEFSARTGYDAEISYLDSQLGRLIHWIDETDRARKTLVILTADHGEGLWEHGEPTHGLFTYDSTLHVPLIVRFPDRKLSGVRISLPVSLVDLMPSTLAWLGLDQPTDTDGRILPLEEDEAESKEGDARLLYFENHSPDELYGWSSLVGIVAGPHKFILAPRPELYNLLKDPHERENLFDRTDARCAAVRNQLDELLTRLAARPVLPREPVHLSENDVAKLRTLGYVAGPGVAQDQIIQPDPARPDPKDMVELYTQIQVATTLIEHQRLSEAAEVLLSIISEDKTNKRAVLLLADLVGDEEVGTHVVDALHEAATQRFDPVVDVYVHGQLGLALAALRRDDEATVAFRNVLAIDPDSVPAHWHLVSALNRLGAPLRDVLPHLQRLVELVPDDWRYVVELAQAYHSAGQTDRAVSLYEKALKRWPDEATLRADLALLYETQGR